MKRFFHATHSAGYLLTLCIITYAGISHGQIYKWTNERGETQYTQTPPPLDASNTKQLNIGNPNSDTNKGGDQKYCQALSDFSIDVAIAMYRGAPSHEIRNIVYADDDKLKEAFNTNESLLTQVIYYIYTFKNSNTSPNKIASLIYTQCRNGSYGGSLAKNGNRKPGDQRVSAGTGWPISQGYVVTSYHVVEHNKDITLHTTTGQTIQAVLFKADKTNDIALLKTSTPNILPKALPLADEEAKLGSTVFTIGYPHPDVMGSKPKLTSGNISSLSGLRDDPRTYQISVPVQAGNSGGPLIDMDGKVLGIVASKLSAINIFKWTGDLPQNVNYAIKIQHLHNLLNQVNEKDLRLDEYSVDTKDLADLATTLQDSIILIVAK